MTRILLIVLILLSIVRFVQARLFSKNAVGWMDLFGETFSDYLSGIIDEVKNGR